MTAIGWLGTPILIGLFVAGLFNYHFGVVAFAALLNAFVGMHAQMGKAEAAKERGVYW